MSSIKLQQIDRRIANLEKIASENVYSVKKQTYSGNTGASNLSQVVKCQSFSSLGDAYTFVRVVHNSIPNTLSFAKKYNPVDELEDTQKDVIGILLDVADSSDQLVSVQVSGVQQVRVGQSASYGNGIKAGDKIGIDENNRAITVENDEVAVALESQHSDDDLILVYFTGVVSAGSGSGGILAKITSSGILGHIGDLYEEGPSLPSTVTDVSFILIPPSLSVSLPVDSWFFANKIGEFYYIWVPTWL